MEIGTWKKLISIVGLLILELGHLINSRALIITGLIISIIGIILIVLVK